MVDRRYDLARPPRVEYKSPQRIRQERQQAAMTRRNFLGIALGVAGAGGLAWAELTDKTHIFDTLGNLAKGKGEAKPTGGVKIEATKGATPTRPVEPTVAPAAKPTTEITPTEAKEADRRGELKEECKKAFRDFSTQFPNILEISPGKDYPLVNTEVGSDFYGLVYQRAGQATGSDTGVYEKMTVAKSDYDANLHELVHFSGTLFWEIERNKGIKNAAEGVSGEANMLFFELALDNSLINLSSATYLATFVEDNWAEITKGFNKPELLKKNGDIDYLKGMAYAYMLSSIKGILANVETRSGGKYYETLMNFAREKQVGEVYEQGRISGYRLEPGGNVPIVPKEKFIPKQVSNKVATRVAESAKAQPTATKAATRVPTTLPKMTVAVKEPTVRPAATTEIKPTVAVEKPVVSGTEFGGPELLNKYMEAKRKFEVVKHGYKHKAHHWETLKSRLGLTPGAVLTEKQKRIDPRAVVVHYTAGGTDESCTDYLAGQGQPVPTVHFVLGRDGRTHQVFADEEKYTFEFHATGINPIAFGVEIVAESKDDITPEQVAGLALLIEQLKRENSGIELITSHQNSHIAAQRLKEKYKLGPEVHNEATGKGDPGGKTMRGLNFLLGAAGISGVRVLEEDLR